MSYKDTDITEASAVTKSVVLDWRDQILERASVTTWNSYLRQMRALFSFGEDTELLDHNVFKSARYMPVSQERKKTVPRATLRRALTLLDSPSEVMTPGWFWAIVIRFIYVTGMRRAQLVALRWPDVDLDAQEIRLTAEGSKTKRE